MYFYCQSYLAFNFALSHKDYTIITSNPDIVKACKYLKFKVISHKEFSLIDYLFRRKKIQNEICRISEIINKSEFHFSHNQFALFCFILTQNLLNKKNRVIFHDFELKFQKNQFINFRSIYYKIICKILYFNYSIPLEIRSPKKKIYVISLKTTSINHLEKIHYIDGEYNELIENIMINFNLKHEKISNVFIDQGLVSSPYINDNLIEVSKLKNILFLKNFTIKEHPIHTNISFFENFKKLPSYLPVEIFFNSIKGQVVSIYSHALIIASKYKNIQAISLIYLINDEEMKKNMMERLKIESNNKIIFISSLEEFEILIAKK
jgi:hypothetical protein